MRGIFDKIQALKDRMTLRASSGPIGIGLIGIGGWGASNARQIMRSRRFNIVGVHDVQIETGKRFASIYRTSFYSQIEDLLGNSSIQAVCITIPNNFHVDTVKDAANARKHIFIEKPLASSPIDCREVGQYCKVRQVILQVGHQMRRDPVFREIKRVLDSGALGRPLFVQGVYTLDRRSRDDWRRNPKACPGGSMEQLGVHLIDVLIYLFGLPHGTHGWAENIPSCSDAPDLGCVSLSFDHGIHAAISTSFSSPTHMRLEFFFDRGNLVTDGQTLWISRGHSAAKAFKPKGIQGCMAQFVEFADSIERGQEPETGAVEAAAVMDAVRSIYSGQGGVVRD